jgi:hypothetical protein
MRIIALLTWMVGYLPSSYAIVTPNLPFRPCNTVKQRPDASIKCPLDQILTEVYPFPITPVRAAYRVHVADAMYGEEIYMPMRAEVAQDPE